MYSPNGAISSLDTNICDPWQTKVFLEAIFGGVTADKWVDVYLRSENVNIEFLSFFANVNFQVQPLSSRLWKHHLHQLSVRHTSQKVLIMAIVVVKITNTFTNNSFVSIVPLKKLTFPDNDYDYIVGDIIRWSRCDTKNIGLTMLCKFDGDVPLPAVWSHQV